MEPATSAPQRAKTYSGKPNDQVIKPGPFGDRRPSRQSDTLCPRRVSGFKIRVSPVPHQLGQGYSHWANGFTPPTECRCIGKVGTLLDADQSRRQNRTDRPGIDPSISMSTDRAINRAMVHAGATPDAAQHLAEFRAEQFRAPVVEQHNMVGFRPIDVAGPAWSGGKSCVCGALLAGRRAGEKTQDAGQVFPCR